MSPLCVCLLSVNIDWSLMTAGDTQTRRRRHLIDLKKDRKEKVVESTTRNGGEANATMNNVGFFSSCELCKGRADIYPTPHQRTNVAQGRF